MASLLLLLVLGYAGSHPVLWDMPAATPINYQEFVDQIHHTQSQTAASVIVINVPAQSATDATATLDLSTSVSATFAPVVESTFAALSTTFETEDRFLSAVVATENVVEHFLEDFLQDVTPESYEAVSAGSTTEVALYETALSSVYTTPSSVDVEDSTAKCFQLVAEAPLSIVVLVFLATGKYYLCFFFGMYMVLPFSSL